MNVIPMFGSTIGKIFEPLFEVMAWLIVFFYEACPELCHRHRPAHGRGHGRDGTANRQEHPFDGVDAEARPRVEEASQKYKGDKQTLNEETMKLYREHGVNPAGGCLPMLIQFPIFIILYDVIRGLTNTVKTGCAKARARLPGTSVTGRSSTPIS